MAVEVLVPPLGQTVDTLALVRWLKQEGEVVRQGEPLFAVETDKATLEVEAPASGVLYGVTARPGDAVKVLSTIAVIGVAQEIDSAADAAASSVQTPDTRLFVSPRARRLAEAEGVPLSAVQATGPQGAIVERDVRAYVAEAKIKAKVKDEDEAEQVSASSLAFASVSPVARRMAEEAGLDWRRLSGSGPRSQVTREDIEAAIARRSAVQRAEAPGSAPALPAGFPLTGIRGVIAERMVASHSQTAPVTLMAEADASALVELRRRLAADAAHVSYNALFLTILAKALREHPRLNAALAGQTVTLWPQAAIGLAVDTDRGLLAPVVREIERKGLAELTAETASLAERARNGKCIPDELTGSTFTLTNLGMYGIDAFTPIINLPECAILGVGRIKTQPVWNGDHIEPRELVWLSLTFDHRLVDGGPAARFLQRVVQLVEKPHLLMA